MSTVSRIRLLGKVALALSVGASLCAQETTGQLVGSVKDPKNAPLAGARILIRAPQLIQPRTVVTDSQGGFRAPLLPPGDYSVTVTKDGFAGSMATNLRISVGANIRQDFTLKPVTTASTVVEVVASAGSVDKTDTKTSTTLSAETLIPSRRLLQPADCRHTGRRQIGWGAGIGWDLGQRRLVQRRVRHCRMRSWHLRVGRRRHCDAGRVILTGGDCHENRAGDGR